MGIEWRDAGGAVQPVAARLDGTVVHTTLYLACYSRRDARLAGQLPITLCASQRVVGMT